MHTASFLAWVAAGIAMLVPNGMPLADDTGALVAARWKPVRVKYTHRGFNAAYECATVDDLIRNILILYGAHPLTKVELRGCPDRAASHRFIVIVTTAIPIPADDSAPIDSSDTEKIVEQLRLTSPEEAVAAHWQTLRLAELEPRIVTGFHCELIDNIAKHLFPALGIKTGPRIERCAPDYSELRVPTLEATVLFPLF